MDDIVIHAEKLTKKFDDLVAVDGIDFEIKKGECFGFLGPNGAGKTSTVRMIFCASPKTSGMLEVLGMDVDTEPSTIKQNIGVVQQENNLDPDFTAFENLLVYSRYYSIPKKEAAEKAINLLEFLHLSQKKDTEIEELSGGMKRRLMIARGLLNTPKILVLDEPTTGLDPQARHLIWTKVRSLRAEGVTIILTTHYMDEAAALCDRLVIMEKGKILIRGSPAELVKKHSGGGEVLEIGGDESQRDEIVAHLKESRGDKAPEMESTSERLYIYSDDCHKISDELQAKFQIKDRLIRTANLEDVFLKLTGRGLRD
jgi:lipooligosaccharide transport system ATP-binding protein